MPLGDTGLREGRAEACAELVRAHGPRMLALARRLLRAEEPATSALVEAFQIVFRAAVEGALEADVERWLQRVVIDVCVTRLGSRLDGPEAPDAALLPAFDDCGCYRNHVRAWRGLEGLDTPVPPTEIRQRIDELPEPYRLVLILCDVERLGTQELAGCLRIPSALAKLRLHQARQALLTLLQPRFALSS